MSTIDTEKVKNIAKLAHIALEEAAIPTYQKDISNILTLVEELNNVPTKTITPMAHPLDFHQRLREDTVSEHDNRENFLALTPHTEAGLYLVPKVIEDQA